MHKAILLSRQKDVDYTEEIIRCVEFMVAQARKSKWNMVEIYYQASQSYNWYVADEALKAIKRNI